SYGQSESSSTRKKDFCLTSDEKLEAIRRVALVKAEAEKIKHGLIVLKLIFENQISIRKVESILKTHHTLVEAKIYQLAEIIEKCYKKKLDNYAPVFLMKKSKCNIVS